jgi:hypothetical protein
MNAVFQSVEAAFPLPWLLKEHYKSSTAELVSDLLFQHVACKPEPAGTDSEKDRHVYNCLLVALDFIDGDSSADDMRWALANVTCALSLDIKDGEGLPAYSSIARVVHRLLNYELERLANPIEGGVLS